MKTNHLFTLFVFLVSTSLGILLTEVSSISQVNQNGGSIANKKSIEPKTGEKNIPSSAIPSTNSNEVRGAEANSHDSSPLPLTLGSLSGLFHLLEIAGLVWAYLKIQQLTEKSRDSRSQIKSLTDRLSASEQKQKNQGDQLKTISSETENARNLISKMNVIEQATQKKSNSISYTDALVKTALPPPPSKVETATSIDNSSYLIPKFQGIDVGIFLPCYPFLDTYRQSSDIFKKQYTPKTVAEDADNLQKRRSGGYQEIILGEDRLGIYWLFNDTNTTYLVPSPKLKVNDLNIRNVGGLFTCENYTPGYQHITIVRPAIVSAQLGGNERWKLEKKGILEFA